MYLVILMTGYFNPLNAELNPICHLLALAGAHHFVHVSRLRVNDRLCHVQAISHWPVIADSGD